MSYEEINISRPKGQKDYCCEWCPETILKGEVHVSRTYRFENQFVSGRMHTNCFEAMETSSDAVMDGWSPCENVRGIPI